MTRRRIIAGVILLAAVAVAVPFAPGVWMKVAYVQILNSRGPTRMTSRERVTVGLKPDGTLPGNLGNLFFRDPNSVEVETAMLTAHEKRHAWLPGRAFIIPDQVCTMCEDSDHTLCFPRHVTGARFIAPDGTLVDLPKDFRCTCTDPSHDGE